MKVKTSILEFIEYSHLDELSESDVLLISKAVEAAGKSYSPYSKFPVGAAVLLNDGQIFLGNNQENISFPAGTCAERTVLNYTHAAFPEKKIKAIAITATNATAKTPVTPCGVCRQTMVELEVHQNEHFRVFLHQIDGLTWEFQSASSLMPLAFEEENLSK